MHRSDPDAHIPSRGSAVPAPMHRRRIRTPVVVLLLSIGLPAGEVRAQQAIDFSLPDLEGNTVRLSDFRGERTVLISFWATWCQPCIKELQHIQDIYTSFGSENLAVLAISVDGAWTDQLEAECGEKPPGFPVLVDRNSRLSRQLGLRRIPTVLVVNRERSVTYVHEGYPGNPEALRAIRTAASAESDA